MGRIGIYGGSFDPVHNGHLHLAETAMKKLSLDEIIFMPANISPFKQDKADVTSGRDRYEMLRLALEDRENMSVSDYELNQTGVSYTVCTLRHMKKLYPDSQLVLLMGSDMLMSFERWYCWQEIMEYAELGCISRNEGDRDILMNQAAKLSEYGEIHVLWEDILPMSSTEVRSFLKKDEDCSCYLPEKVVQYIVKRHLYSR